MVRADTSMTFDIVGHGVERLPCAVPSGHDVEVVEKGEEKLVGLQTGLGRDKRVVQTEREEGSAVSLCRAVLSA